MVKVNVVTVKSNPIPLEFKDIYSACRAMQVLSDSIVGGCAFTVSFEKEKKERSRFSILKED